MTDGAVVSLWRYPVKSMMGEELNASDVTDHGLLGDRSLALVDTETGKVVSAKNPRKWPTMFDFRAVFTTPPVLGSPLPPVRVTLPDGVGVTSDDARFAELLTGALGRSVTLASAAPSEPSLEEYWPDIAELAHRETVTEEAMTSTTFFDLATSMCSPRRRSTGYESSTRRANSRSGAFGPTSSCVPSMTPLSSWRASGWGENFGSATTSCSRSPTTARAA